MNNLEKIKAAWAMGWSAVFIEIDSRRKFIVIGINQDYIGIRDVDGKCGGVALDYPNLEENKYRITGYLYAGELAGNEIPEGQKFIVKEIKKEVYFKKDNGVQLAVGAKNQTEWFDLYDKSELEPYSEPHTD